MGLPGDPAAFVAEAERALNERDAEAAAGVYGDMKAWEPYLAGMDERDLAVHKTLTAVSGDTIVCEWESIAEGRIESKGVEYWRFDDDGKVYEHRLYGHAAAEPPESPLQRLRGAWAQPAAALALLRRGRRR